MGKNILVLTGSPRKDGNSSMLADAFIRGAESAGHTVNRFDAGLAKISGCRDCKTCWNQGVPCSFVDDFDEKFAPLYQKADALVLCSPVYFYNFTSRLQAVLEKTYAYLTPQCKVSVPVRECALLACCGEKGLEAFAGMQAVYEQLCRGMHWQDRGRVLAADIYGKGSIADTGYLRQAERLGQNI